MSYFFHIKVLGLLIIGLSPSILLSQKTLEQKVNEIGDNTVRGIDTNYVSYYQHFYSLRAFTSIRDHSFHLLSPDSKLNYTPNNRIGLGVGIASFPILLDIGFNVKGGESNQTNRFDLQLDFILRSSYLGLVVQSYKGFNISGQDVVQEMFREDIHSTAIHITYAYAFNAKEMATGSIFSGVQKQKKSSGTFLVGGFTSYYQMLADSSIIPLEAEDDFSNLAGLKETQSLGVGILGGYAHIFVLPYNLSLFFNTMIGFGLNWKNVTLNNDENIVPRPDLYRINLRLSLGYSGKRFYLILTAGNYTSFTPLIDNNWAALNVGKGNLTFGYKILKREKKK